MSTGEERRHHPRAEAAIEVRSRLLDPSELPMLATPQGRPDPPIPQLRLIKDGVQVNHLSSVNLSLGGLSAGGELEIDAKQAYAKGSVVVVEFDLADGQSAVRAVAQVTWSESGDGLVRMGLMFLVITDSAFMRIQDYVFRHSPS
jgi:hypothetical protein